MKAKNFAELKTMNVTIEQDFANTFNWSIDSEGYDFDGTIKLPKYERSPIEIDWDTSEQLPTNWEQIEELIEKATIDYISKHKIKF
jgi:hypothetical protein